MKKKFCMVLFMLLFSSTVFANVEAEKYFVNANKAYSNGDYNSAIKYLNNAIKLEPRDSQFYFTLGMCYMAQKNYTSAESAYMQAIKVQPNDFRTYLLLGDLKAAQGRIPAAIDFWKKGLSFKDVPEQAKPAFNAAKIMYSQKIQKAIENQNKASKNLTTNNTGKIKMNLTSEWQKAYFAGDNNKWIEEYGLKGEDVVNYKWTKLITVNYFNGKAYNINLNNYYKQFIASLKQHATELNTTLSLIPISATENEIWFEWSIKGRNESEICRMFKFNNDTYFIHYTHKQATFTAAEKNNAKNILNNIKII